MAATATLTEEQVSLKLVLNKEISKVLFAEAGKDFVDVLFSFLTLPLGTIIRLVGKETDMQLKPDRVGCLSSLYESVANLDEECLWSETCKEMLLLPRNSMEAYCRSLKLNIDDTEPTKYFICENRDCSRYKSSAMLSTFRNKRCNCGNLLAEQIFPKSSNVCEGFVNVNAIFIITDDLNVMPNSLSTSFLLLKNSGIENMCSVQVMTVNVTKEKVLDLLKCCLLSKTPLTDLFLEKKPFLERFDATRLLCDFAASGGNQINVKLMQIKSNGKIVFAQGEEDFADFIFSFLTFPLGGVVQMLEGCSSLGSVDGLYKSIVDLDESYLMTKELKNLLVDPKLAQQFKTSNQMLRICESHVPRYFCYTYTESRRGRRRGIFISKCYPTSENRKCCSSNETCIPLDLVDPKSSTGTPKGYAKGSTMYVVTDDLVVTPMSSISGISLLNSLNTPLGDFEEKVVSIGIKEGLSILKSSLTSKSALTNGLSNLLTNVKEEE